MSSNELDKIKERYNDRDAPGGQTEFWTYYNPVVLHIAQERERVLLNTLKQEKISLGNAKILDVGAGVGTEILNLIRWGADKSRINGVDLSKSRVETARNKYDIELMNCSADSLPYTNNSFDIVIQNVVFSSVLDNEMRNKIAAEMIRVLKPGGIVIWYDARRCRGNVSTFRAINKQEICDLFPDIDFKWRTLTCDLAILKLANILGGNVLMSLVDIFPMFRTHLLAIGRKM